MGQRFDNISTWLNTYECTRSTTEWICEGLEIEDYVVQSHPDVSPAKWHLGHTTWFFEQFILVKFLKNYKCFNEQLHLIFNSYYKSMGNHWIQGDRGQLSRPTVSEIKHYRQYVNASINELLTGYLDEKARMEILSLLELGINHEQQHQELLLMDIKYNFAVNPFNVSYLTENYPSSYPCSASYLSVKGGLYQIGQSGIDRFCYDNETPRHKVHIDSFQIRNSLVTNGEYLEFIKDNGYNCPDYWYSDAWALIQSQCWQAPLYWFEKEGHWFYKTLYGEQAVDLNEPVSHISFYEAAAFAKWAKKRLPTEFEWEVASQELALSVSNNFMEKRKFAPVLSQIDFTNDNHLISLHGGLWEWMQSSYHAYPGYVAPEGALGEYNSKFMNGPMVLRGGCYATPEQHYRSTYRNFFNADKRWMFSGIRLCKDNT
ncbi:hypothetical protein BGC07_11505 [Piscirickettsia litoralis]|uniref:Ergothioneine biosynthesis protein EgtB n=2 Tax=Piscirickettsia litoralis TaxID=1891921 RepID=A0ABX3A5D9_9GAMM|nr:hypothetical protein BGC07_11505 [Piscirickettsia litoralis]